LINPLKERVRLAVEIDKFEYRNRRKGHDSDWLKKAVVEMELDGSGSGSGTDEENYKPKSKERADLMRKQLKNLLSQPLLPTGASARYITSSIVDDLPSKLLNNLYTADGLKRLPGTIKMRAQDQLLSVKRKR
jgi:ATP-dependent RNA helicase DDX24/MAK5